MDELAVVFGVHRTSVAACLRRMDVQLRGQGLNDEQLREAKKLYGQGWSLARLGERYECHTTTVHQAFAREGVPRRRPRER